MKKLAFSILALGLFVISGCVQSNNTPTTTAKQSANPTTQTSKQSIENPLTQANKNPETKTTEPSFFFKSDISQINYQGTFMFNEIVKKEVKLNINEVAHPKYGKWYELKLESINGDTHEFHSYNSKVETGYYETFDWEKNKGLTHFRRGYGAGRDSIELYLK